MNVDPNRPLVTILKSCDLAGVSRRTIYNWLRDGKLEYVRTAGGSIRIYVDSLFRSRTGDGEPSRLAATTQSAGGSCPVPRPDSNRQSPKL